MMAHGTLSEPCPRCNASGVPCPVVPAEKAPIRIMHKKNTAVNQQSTMKNMGMMHTSAEDTNEV